MKMVYLVGPPATGKSTVMALVRDQLGLVTGDWFRLWPDQHGEFRGQPLEDVISGEVRGLSLGIVREGGYSGTDAIGMASHSEALRWAEQADMPALVLGEGRRLGTIRFITAMARRGSVTLGYLWAPQDVLDQRCAARGSNQNMGFRLGSATQAQNTVNAARSLGAQVLSFDTSLVSAEECARDLARVAQGSARG